MLICYLCTSVLVFLSQESASQVFRRHKHANSFLEELKQGNLERECKEEQCSYEEAREVFEKEEPTNEFWNKHVDGDQCEKKPCQNNADCKDVWQKIPNLCETSNGDCDHFCKMERDIKCSCVEGYKVGQDGKSCIPDMKLKDPIKFSKYIIPACLPNREFTEQVLMNQLFAQISGFGRIHEQGRQSTKLQKLNVPYVDRHVYIESSLSKITAIMSCAG
ncbi:coagulation factor X-like [Polyodon spathula]|uniref:coagulation factor X-like n=1 Tax=Polyodon spathula TaxID=7913 RepID=UPI001B7E0FF8|nr:coagulation factor X-like [Polyodon spathula]